MWMFSIYQFRFRSFYSAFFSPGAMLKERSSVCYLGIEFLDIE